MTDLRGSAASGAAVAEWDADHATLRAEIDAALNRVGALLPQDIPGDVADAVRYALRSPGKRMRGMLLVSAYHAAGGRGDAVPLAAAVEIIHAYSLVHDDLPCMDDDDMRRGRPTTHKVYGVPAATVAGVVMIPLAARCAVAASAQLQLSLGATGAIVQTLMHAAGAAGMIGGQWRDLQAEGEVVALETLESVHRAKTGALVAAAAEIGGIAAGASRPAWHALAEYGTDLGLAFQIVDDILDITATTAQLGKTAGRDVALSKSTYPGVLGIEGAAARARELVESGCHVLEQEGLLTPELRAWATLVITRTH